MRKIRFKHNIFLLILLMFLTSCSTFNVSLDSLLVPPKVNDISIQGTWKVENFYYIHEYPSNMGSVIPKDSYVFLSKNYLRINDKVFNYDSYKIKSTTLSEYMRVKFKISDFSFLNLKDKEVYIFSIHDENNNVYEFVEYDKDTILFYYYYDNIMYTLKKVSDDIDKDFENFAKEKYKNNTSSNKPDKIIDTGFLISFRSEREVSGASIPKSSYNSVWFYQKSDGTYSYKIFDGIIIPKNDEILKVNIKLSDKNNLYEKISIEKLNKDTKKWEEIETLNNNEEFINQFIDITYINENYIGINYDQNTEYLGKINTDKIAMLSIDNPYIEKRVKFSDILKGHEDDFISSRKKALEFINKHDLKMYDEEIREDSFKLSRYAGSWFLRGRINPKTGYNVSPIDFDINVLPTRELVRYNDSSINLGQIKLKQPDVLDGFLSPNRDIIVLITKDNMYIHKIIGDKISTNSIGEFPLKDGDSVISINWYIFNSAVNVNKLLEEIK